MKNYNHFCFSAAHQDPLTRGHTLAADVMAIATKTMICFENRKVGRCLSATRREEKLQAAGGIEVGQHLQLRINSTLQQAGEGGVEEGVGGVHYRYA